MSLHCLILRLNRSLTWLDFEIFHWVKSLTLRYCVVALFNAEIVSSVRLAGSFCWGCGACTVNTWPRGGKRQTPPCSVNNAKCYMALSFSCRDRDVNLASGERLLNTTGACGRNKRLVTYTYYIDI